MEPMPKRKQEFTASAEFAIGPSTPEWQRLMARLLVPTITKPVPEASVDAVRPPKTPGSNQQKLTKGNGRKRKRRK